MKTVQNLSLLKITVLVPAVALLMYPVLVYLSPSPAFGWEFHGRMTGGGSICEPNGCVETHGNTDSTGRVTHGFELHCAPEDLPNNLEVNDHRTDSRFKLGTLVDVTCTDDPLIEPTPPGAGFDTYKGIGTGDYCVGGGSCVSACARWTFTDAGEPGSNDSAQIEVWTGACFTGTLVISIGPATLTFGNHQAHKNP